MNWLTKQGCPKESSFFRNKHLEITSKQSLQPILGELQMIQISTLKQKISIFFNRQLTKNWKKLKSGLMSIDCLWISTKLILLFSSHFSIFPLTLSISKLETFQSKRLAMSNFLEFFWMKIFHGSIIWLNCPKNWLELVVCSSE